MEKNVQEFLKTRRLAVVGVSHNEQKFGNAIYKELKRQGIEVYGVNPTLEFIDGDRCYASLADLAGKVDGTVISLPPQKAAAVVREAAAAGLTKIWLQQGSQSDETARAALESGVSPVEGKCILMYTGEVKSVHAFHRFFVRLFGQY